MKNGTPGFIGARLKEGREARGLSAIALADLVGVTRAAVSQYEKNEQSPRPEVMERITEVLMLPAAYFRFIPKYAETGIVFYRSLSSATQTARTRAERRYGWLREIVGYLRDFIQFPPTNLPDFDLPADPTHIRKDEIEKIASYTRSFWHLGDGPIKDVISLLESNGIVVARDELGADTLDAFSDAMGMGDTPFMILGSEKSVAVRSRLDAAHELGHLILHKKVDRNRISRKTDHALLEAQAFNFAGAFLFPAEAFAREFYSASLDSLKILKPKWKVSIAMMIKRAQELDFVASDKVRRLWIYYARRGWKTNEPLDDEIPVETPTLLRLAFEMLIGDKLQQRADILAQLPYYPRDIETLASLPQGFFNDKQPQLEPPIYIFSKTRSGVRTRNSENYGQTAEVIRLPHKKTR